MRYEDWTFLETEVRLQEHAELRSALQLNTVPDYTSLFCFLVRLDLDDVARVMDQIVPRMPGRWPKSSRGSRGCHRLGTRRSEQLLYPSGGAFWPTASHLEALAEVARGGRCGTTTDSDATGTPGTLE